MSIFKPPSCCGSFDSTHTQQMRCGLLPALPIQLPHLTGKASYINAPHPQSISFLSFRNQWLTADDISGKQLSFEYHKRFKPPSCCGTFDSQTRCGLLPALPFQPTHTSLAKPPISARLTQNMSVAKDHLVPALLCKTISDQQDVYLARLGGV